jgi:hypothetical protein
MKNIYVLVFAFFICFNAVSQTASRVIAFANYGADTTLPCADSGGYKYSHGRGGEIYSTPFPNFECNYPFTFAYTYDFETGHNGLVKSDTSWELSNTDTDVSVQFFDSNNNIVKSSSQISSRNNALTYIAYYYLYDTNNNLIQQLDTNWISGRWVNIIRNTSAYDQNNEVVETTKLSMSRSDSNWLTGYKDTYLYDGTGKYISYRGDNWDGETNAWDDPDSTIGRLFYNRNLPDSCIDFSYIYHYFTSPATTDPISYYFSPTQDTVIANFYGYNINNWIVYMTRMTTYDSHHNRTSITQDVIDTAVTWISSYRTTWSYNAFDQVACERSYYKDSSGNWIFNNLTRYYYETYTPEVAYSINTMTVFPSPAKNSITIKLEWDKPQPFTIAIFDAVGRLVMQWNEAATREYKETISLPYAPSGNYFIRAIGGKQKLVKQFVIIN